MKEKEHTKALNDLQNVATKKSIIIPTKVIKKGENAN